MGNNLEYSIIEEQVVNLYDADLLTLEILDILCGVFEGADPDSGGSQGLTTVKDGKTFEEVCIALASPGFEMPSIEFFEGEDDMGIYWDEFSRITEERWGWR